MSLVQEALRTRKQQKDDSIKSYPKPFIIGDCEKAIALLDKIEAQLHTEKGQDHLKKMIETSTNTNTWIYESVKYNFDLNRQVQNNAQILRRSLDHIPRLEHCTLYLEVAEVADFRNFSTVGIEVMLSIVSLGALTPTTPATVVKIVYEPPKQTLMRWVASFWH